MAYDNHVEEAFRALERHDAATRLISIQIERVKLQIDPSIEVFNVIVAKLDGEWRHTAATEEGLQNFLEGVRAGASLMGAQVEVSSIPTKPTTILISDHMFS